MEIAKITAPNKDLFDFNTFDGSWVYATGDTWDLSPGASYNDNFTITVADSFGGSDSYQLKFNITGVAFISGITRSNNFKATSAAACDEGRNTNVYLKAADAGSINALDVGDFFI